jgi:hypothetical protein
MFEFRPNLPLCFACAALVGMQVTYHTYQKLLMYKLQEMRGPRFFIPKFLLPKKFDYFVEIPDHIDLEHGVSQEVQSLFSEECSVCMNPLHQTPAL